MVYFRNMAKVYVDDWVQPNKKEKEKEKENVDTSNLSIGDGVKLKNPLGESFWVTFEGVYDDYLYGRVDNYLYNGSEYSYGDIVIFKASDVRDISNDQTRQEKFAHVVQIVKLFKIEMGRLPTVQELQLLTM